MKKLALAIAITSEAFKDTLDKGGQPYILHCLRVMMNTRGDECTKCAAVMHDLIEDTHYGFTDLAKLGFSQKTISILTLLTHLPETPYMDYIKIIGTSPEATEIKLRDLEDNSNIMRLKGIRKKDFDRLEKYHIAYSYLKQD